MQMNIKNPEACRMAQQLAAAKGKSVTAVVPEALAAELARLPVVAPADLEARIEKVLASAAKVRAAMAAPLPTQAELDAWMYDEHGLPR